LSIWYIFCPFSIFYGHLVYFPPVLVYCTNKHLATLDCSTLCTLRNDATDVGAGVVKRHTGFQPCWANAFFCIGTDEKQWPYASTDMARLTHFERYQHKYFLAVNGPVCKLIILLVGFWLALQGSIFHFYLDNLFL
jgi:hypothetical protein